MLVQFSLKYGIKKNNRENSVSLSYIDNFHHCISWLTNVWFMNLNIIIVKEEEKIQDFFEKLF